MAEEVLKSGPMEGEGGEGEGRAAFEGMEALARAIETGKASLRKTLPPLTIYICTCVHCKHSFSHNFQFCSLISLSRPLVAVLSRVQISLRDTVVQIMYHSQDYMHQYFIRVRVQR